VGHMASVTSSVGGQSVGVSNSSAAVTAIASSIINQAGIVAATGNTTLQGQFFATTASNTTVTGGAAVTVGVLSSPNGVFVTGASQASEVIAGDLTNSTIINTNPNGSLIAFTGAGGNALVGNGVVNAFQTGVGGNDAVNFGNGAGAAQTNVLTSQGQDTVSIVGAGAGKGQVNFVSATGHGNDILNLTNGASLTFVNNSTMTSAIAASAGSNMNLVGSGNTSVIAGAGAEGFAISTSSGNVTLSGSTSGGADTFNFVRLGQNVSGSVDVVANFTSSDSVNLLGYGGNYNAQVVNGSTVLTLGDGSKVIFAGITSSTAVTSRITHNV